MGAAESKAKSKTEIKNRVLNQTTINSYNETVNEQMTKSVTDIAQTCRGSAALQQTLSVGDLEILNSEGVTIDFSQTATVSFDFTCEQIASVINTVQDSMIETIVNQIESSADNQLMNDIKEKMAANAKTEPFAFGGASASTDSSTSMDNQTINSTDVNIRNVTRNIVKNEFETKISSKCIAEATSLQAADFKGIKIKNAKDIGVNFAQEAIVTMVADCVQEASVGNESIKRLAKLADFKIKDDKKTSNKNKSDKDHSADALAGGLFTAIIPIVSSSLSSFLSLAALALGFVMMGGLDQIPI
jgi:hypothetical protein